MGDMQHFVRSKATQLDRQSANNLKVPVNGLAFKKPSAGSPMPAPRAPTNHGHARPQMHTDTFNSEYEDSVTTAEGRPQTPQTPKRLSKVKALPDRLMRNLDHSLGSVVPRLQQSNDVPLRRDFARNDTDMRGLHADTTDGRDAIISGSAAQIRPRSSSQRLLPDSDDSDDNEASDFQRVNNFIERDDQHDGQIQPGHNSPYDQDDQDDVDGMKFPRSVSPHDSYPSTTSGRDTNSVIEEPHRYVTQTVHDVQQKHVKQHQLHEQQLQHESQQLAEAQPGFETQQVLEMQHSLEGLKQPVESFQDNEHRHHQAELATDYRRAETLRKQQQQPNDSLRSSKRKVQHESEETVILNPIGHVQQLDGEPCRSHPALTPMSPPSTVTRSNGRLPQSLGSSGSNIESPHGLFKDNGGQSRGMLMQTSPKSTDRSRVNLASLQYEPSMLFGMKFATLQSEAFDARPHVSESLSETDGKSMSLVNKLAEIEFTSPNEQQQFFGAMTMEEWAKSGDWFTERFAALMQSIQESRQERRSLAVEFEEEIARRHKAIALEHDNLDGALTGMKRSGKNVLTQSTPKRGRV